MRVYHIELSHFNDKGDWYGHELINWYGHHGYVVQAKHRRFMRVPGVWCLECAYT